MSGRTFGGQEYQVALRKESVDRNTILTQTSTNIVVALRKESVDRNGFCDLEPIRNPGRSPQGERG